MGCIEIKQIVVCTHISLWINRNMGCIEIITTLMTTNGQAPINRNMGCIEIGKFLRPCCTEKDKP